MNSAVLCFLFLAILVNDICIFAKLVLVQIQNSFCCHHGKVHCCAQEGCQAQGDRQGQSAKAKAASQPSGVERKPMRFLGQKFPSSSLPWSTKPRTQRIHKLRVHRWSWRIGVTRKSKSKSRSTCAYIYLFIYFSKMWSIRPIHFWLIFIMKLLNSNMHETHILFSSSVPLKPLPCRNTTPCRQMRRGALWPSTLLEAGSRATFSRFSPVWNPAAPLRRLPLKLLKGTCL